MFIRRDVVQNDTSIVSGRDNIRCMLDICVERYNHTICGINLISTDQIRIFIAL